MGELVLAGVDLSKIRVAQAAASKDAASRAVQRLQVFLAGPYIEISKAGDVTPNNDTTASYLRYFLYKRVSSEGHVVYLGEDTLLRENGDKHYGEYSNAVVYERHYIKKHAHALIVILGSPGSFCEIGDWAPEPDICEKMLVIIDKQFEGKPSYISSGIVPFATINKARVSYLDFTDAESVLLECNRHLESVSAKQRLDELYGRGR